LAKIGRLNLLKKNFSEILISTEVYSEVVIKGNERGYGDAFLLEKLVESGNISKKDIRISKFKDLPIGKGELETIELAMKLDINNVLMDDAKGRRFARLYGLQTKGTLWILTKAYEDDLLTKEELTTSITELIKNGFRIKEDILIEILKDLI
jgi:predicted nucleic acid-binding protein